MIDLNKDELLKEARAMYTYFPGSYGSRMLTIIEMLCKPTWMPIETAPKDGTNVLVYQCYLKFEKQTGEQEYGYCIEVGCWERDTWRIKAFTPQYGANPTHWMPLPKPPALGEKKDD